MEPAMRASTAIPTMEFTKLAAAIIKMRSGKCCLSRGTALMANTPTPDNTVDTTYQVRGVSVISTTGAHSHFNQLIIIPDAMMSVASEIGMPRWLATFVKATEPKPYKAPKGKYKMVQTTGCGMQGSRREAAL